MSGPFNLKFNVCLMPSDDRSGQVNMIHHYCKIGARVFIPLHGTGGLKWRDIATWPGLLVRSTTAPQKRNLEIHGFKRKENLMIWGRVLLGDLFGEDRFLLKEDNGPLYEDKSISCELIDFSKNKVRIDLFHTLRCYDGLLKQALELKRRYFPKAIWVSSSVDPRGLVRTEGPKPKNICKMMPAVYDTRYRDLNCFECFPSGFEFDLLNVSRNPKERAGFASFNHNYQKRQPEDFLLFQKLNERLKKYGILIPNYGGNVTGQGADIKHSQRGRGKAQTLSIREAAKLTARLKAIVHLKKSDWGGGVIWYALMAGTPIITHRNYVKASHADKVLKHDYNAIIVNSLGEAVEAVLKMEKDRVHQEKLSQGMQNIFKKLVNQEYWDKFKQFIARALKTPR